MQLGGTVPGLRGWEEAEEWGLRRGDRRRAQTQPGGAGGWALCCPPWRLFQGGRPLQRGPDTPWGHLSLRGGSPAAQGPAQGHMQTVLRQLPARSAAKGAQRGPGASGRWGPQSRGLRTRLSCCSPAGDQSLQCAVPGPLGAHREQVSILSPVLPGAQGWAWVSLQILPRMYVHGWPSK